MDRWVMVTVNNLWIHGKITDWIISWMLVCARIILRWWNLMLSVVGVSESRHWLKRQLWILFCSQFCYKPSILLCPHTFCCVSGSPFFYPLFPHTSTSSICSADLLEQSESWRPGRQEAGHSPLEGKPTAVFSSFDRTGCAVNLTLASSCLSLSSVLSSPCLTSWLTDESSTTTSPVEEPGRWRSSTAAETYTQETRGAGCGSLSTDAPAIWRPPTPRGPHQKPKCGSAAPLRKVRLKAKLEPMNLLNKCITGFVKNKLSCLLKMSKSKNIIKCVFKAQLYLALYLNDSKHWKNCWNKAFFFIAYYFILQLI